MARIFALMLQHHWFSATFPKSPHLTTNRSYYKVGLVDENSALFNNGNLIVAINEQWNCGPKIVKLSLIHNSLFWRDIVQKPMRVWQHCSENNNTLATVPGNE